VCVGFSEIKEEKKIYVREGSSSSPLSVFCEGIKSNFRLSAFSSLITSHCHRQNFAEKKRWQEGKLENTQISATPKVSHSEFLFFELFNLLLLFEVLIFIGF